METSDIPPPNAPEWSVSDLSAALKRTVEDAFAYVKLRGEVSGFRGPVASGHVYFSLKDATAKIDAVIWKASFARLKFRPEEGLEVIAHGRLTTFPGKSSYQIVIERLEPAGVGALMLLLEERRKKLAAEGLFAEARKRPLPYLPGVIGVVTSPTGAVIRDILHRLADRFPRHVLVWPVRVQGETSAAEVAAAIRGFSDLRVGGPIPRPDVVIVARGGGSLEDLWSFNEEIVVRAASASTIPLVSAVGHETDWTLIDHVADRRAPTPTGAAEIVVPVRSDLIAGLGDLAARHEAGMARLIERRRNDFRLAARALPAPARLFAAQRQMLDLLAARLATQNPATALARRRERLDGLAARLTPDLIVRRAVEGRQRAGASFERLVVAMDTGLDRRRQRLDRLTALLAAYSVQGVLDRGFALVFDGAGRTVRDRAAALEARTLAVRFRDGSVPATTTPAPAEPVIPAPAIIEEPKPRASRQKPAPGQGSLF